MKKNRTADAAPAKRLIGSRAAAVLLAAVTAAASIPVLPAASETAWAAVSDNEIVTKAVELIQEEEGDYNTVAPNDNGALSVGFLQWHGDNAKALLKKIVTSNRSSAQKLLKGVTGSDALLNEILGNSSWSSRTLNATEQIALRRLLNPSYMPSSKTIQDQLARTYINNYISDGKSLGITNPSALVYYADLANQGGRGGAKIVGRRALAIAQAEGKKSVYLNELMKAVMTYKYNAGQKKFTSLAQYTSRRFRVYKKTTALGWTYKYSSDEQIPMEKSGSINTTGGIRWIQKNLNNLFLEQNNKSAVIAVTGAYDDATKNAVRTFQKANDLEADGDAGYDTIRTMLYQLGQGEQTTGKNISADYDNYLKTKTASEKTRKIQKQLKKMGYYSGALDGISSSSLTAGLKKFQKAAGLSQTGKADSKTTQELEALTKITGRKTTATAKNLKKKITIQWKKVPEAEGYNIYRRQAGKSWKKIATVKKNSAVQYKDKTAKAKKTYYYCVRGYRKAGTIVKCSKLVSSKAMKRKR